MFVIMLGNKQVHSVGKVTPLPYQMSLKIPPYQMTAKFHVISYVKKNFLIALYDTICKEI